MDEKYNSVIGNPYNGCERCKKPFLNPYARTSNYYSKESDFYKYGLNFYHKECMEQEAKENLKELNNYEILSREEFELNYDYWYWRNKTLSFELVDKMYDKFFEEVDKGMYKEGNYKGIHNYLIFKNTENFGKIRDYYLNFKSNFLLENNIYAIITLNDCNGKCYWPFKTEPDPSKKPIENNKI